MLPVCRSAVSAGRQELRPITRVCGQRPAETTLGFSAGSEPEPARSAEQVAVCRQFLDQNLPKGWSPSQVEIHDIRKPEISGKIADRRRAGSVQADACSVSFFL
jgi:hypothetical protein